MKKKFKFTVGNLEQSAEGMLNSLVAEVDVLKQESDACLTMFHNTINKLSSTNERIDAKITSIEDHIAALNSHKEVMTAKRTANANIQSKIENFLA